MLKIPKVGEPLSGFKFITEINADGQLEVCIVYTIKTAYDTVVHKMQNYIINTDVRWNNINTIKKTIDQHLLSAQGNTKVFMKYDKARYYVWFDHDQFSGALVP